MTDLLTVVSALPAGQVALWERDPRHPGGEVFIAGPGPRQAAATPAVLGAIARNVLAIVPHVVEDDFPFDVASATVEETLAAVEAGDLSAAEALAQEQAARKPRKTLIERLEALQP